MHDLLVVGPHGSGTHIHTELARELLPDLDIEHFSLPYAPVFGHSTRALLVVRRDFHATVRSQERRGLGPTDDYESQVVEGLQQAQTLLWSNTGWSATWSYEDTVKNPRLFAERLMYLVKPTKWHIPEYFGHQMYDGNA